MLSFTKLLDLMGGGVEAAAADTIDACVGETVVEATIIDNALRLELASERTLIIRDSGQSCCETRYMSTDDDLASVRGGKLLSVSVRDGGGAGGEARGDHDVQFLKITTDVGEITVVNHNEHNGYYGGFVISATLVNHFG